MSNRSYKYYRGKRYDSHSTWYFRTCDTTTDIDVIISWSYTSKVRYTLVEESGLIPAINHKLYNLISINKKLWDEAFAKAGTIQDVLF